MFRNLNSIKLFFFENSKYNILSLSNAITGFILIIMLGKWFGLGIKTDVYFSSLIIVSYLGFIVKVGSDAFQQYYLELKFRNKKLADEIYTILISEILLFSTVIIVLYFIFKDVNDFFNKDIKSFLNIFIYIITFQNILNFNKMILSLEKFYSSVYLVDIFINMMNIIALYFCGNKGIIVVAYSTIGATLLAVIWQFNLISSRIGIKFKIGKFNSFKKKLLINIFNNSFKFNAGSIVYNIKDLLLISVFSSFGAGIYSMFSYANKFVGIIIQVVITPIINIFITDVSEIIAKNKFSEINNLVNKILFKIISFFIISAFTIYFILPYILGLFLSTNLEKESLHNIRSIYIYLVIFFTILTLGIPFNNVLNFFKQFNYLLLLRIIFIFLVVLGYIATLFYSLYYVYMLMFLIISQLILLVLFIVRYISTINSLMKQTNTYLAGNK